MNHWNGVSESVPSFTTRRLGNVLWSLFRYSLVHTVCSHVFFFFFHEVTEGKAREETWSSVNYLFFISTSLIYGRNQQVRQGIV